MQKTPESNGPTARFEKSACWKTIKRETQILGADWSECGGYEKNTDNTEASTALCATEDTCKEVLFLSLDDPWLFCPPKAFKLVDNHSQQRIL